MRIVGSAADSCLRKDEGVLCRPSLVRNGNNCYSTCVYIKDTFYWIDQRSIC